jgi:pyrrolidone-carboxylate peptidase
MHALAESADRTKGGFIHVPLLPEQIACRGRRRSRKTEAVRPKGKTNLPSLPLKTMVDALAMVVRESLRTTLPVRLRLNRKTSIDP